MEQEINFNQKQLNKLPLSELIILRKQLSIIIPTFYMDIICDEIDKRIKLIFPDFKRIENDYLKYTIVRKKCH